MKTWYIPLLLIIAVGSFIIGASYKFNFSVTRKWSKPTPTPAAQTVNQDQVLPKEGIVLPIIWEDLGIQLIKLGVIDRTKFTDSTPLLDSADNTSITINSQNSHLILNLLWAFGLANKNSALDAGPMVDKQYGGAGNFASTGGWTLAKGDAMTYYSKYKLVPLTAEQDALVSSVAKNIYRPCCDNSTYFPDCNHGMAMLGLLQLLAANAVSESDMYKIALQVNAYWFPDTYLTLAKYFATQNIPWDKVDPKEVLGANYSSASGYRQILAKIEPIQNQGGGGCGV
ncbi:MAG: hypothetical protein UX80_C0004G0065 [Candidatus Amesbacteria bacterium GW2011_GWA2_47_11b]|uniref:Uncharacterized protein n=3 Tax=Candidatus Amesiibacteriota TaxID=1752730 RepID=A0A0G1UV30_9BACT|nr:MAG: hypothetical protein UX42_C0001G0040 [Microgenomates group bacterium GW2011_GWC1_46_20]KKU58314.1 MAG: hypothetical protein UX80_C0004G0065 [Candidatus Amesbacteria bacterium GW2011_GWA2_47_11b]KKU69903.1 MAG: hypothetical protein UX92_C0007G0026 [Candidatus Amesbacteria bacterium GW2011_GWA1_47_20]KKU84808.1 MAG: hypothetical protein UY11_C0003G0019 [Candidatus Amesbacteria bacterium GW2011_GWC2_47_8]